MRQQGGSEEEADADFAKIEAGEAAAMADDEDGWVCVHTTNVSPVE